MNVLPCPRIDAAEVRSAVHIHAFVTEKKILVYLYFELLEKEKYYRNIMFQKAS